VKTLASISVRKLDDETVALLRVRAAKDGVSMEEEARQILKRTVAATERIGDLAMALFGAENGVDFDLPVREPHEAVEILE